MKKTKHVDLKQLREDAYKAADGQTEFMLVLPLDILTVLDTLDDTSDALVDTERELELATAEANELRQELDALGEDMDTMVDQLNGSTRQES